LEDFVVVADTGLMNKTNISLLESGGYKYIIGANIKSDTEEIKQWITTLKIKLPASGETLTKTMLLTAKHKSIEPLFDKNFWKFF